MKAVLRTIVETAGAWAARSISPALTLKTGSKPAGLCRLTVFKSTICFWDGEGDTTEGIVANYDAIILRIEELKSPLLHIGEAVAPKAFSRSVSSFFAGSEITRREDALRFGVNERSGTDAVLDSRPGAHLRHAELYLARALASKRCGYRVGH